VTSIILAGLQVGDEQRAFWRNRAAAFFTFAFPLLLLVIFASLNRSAHITSLGPGRLAFTQYYVPSMLAFGVMTACFVNVGTILSIRRQSGELKRVHGAPLRPWIFLAGVIGNALILSALLAVAVIGAGVAFFNVTVPDHWAAIALCLAVGTASFCALGVAATVMTTGATAEAAGAVLNGIFFPVVFISGAFFPVSNASILAKIAAVLPVRHFITATFSAFDPRTHASAIHTRDLLVVAAWGIVGAAATLRWFRWQPARR
jgi:ABC-2 type transport system permease protein